MPTFHLDYCDASEDRRDHTPIGQPVRLLIDHPFRDKAWMLVRKMPEPGFFVLATAEDLTIVLFESDFEVQ
jgi:hypothetical protein